MIGIFVWGLVVGSLIGGLFTAVRPYLPYTAATSSATHASQCGRRAAVALGRLTGAPFTGGRC
ncbi:MAG: hypothetical protein J2P35_24035 [Actinobacteria bacterium]|nr:hypothetical protein [Actinomycetota bacterium]